MLNLSSYSPVTLNIEEQGVGSLMPDLLVESANCNHHRWEPHK